MARFRFAHLILLLKFHFEEQELLVLDWLLLSQTFGKVGLYPLIQRCVVALWLRNSGSLLLHFPLIKCLIDSLIILIQTFYLARVPYDGTAFPRRST